MMRKFLLLAIICLPFFVMSQAQRMVLIEEWTNASCNPCAAQNPAFNTLLDENLDKVVSIKYQWYFPGFDPFQEQNPDEINNRGEYYDLSGVPTAWIDGQLPDNNYGDGSGDWGGYAGGPYGYTQGIIDWSYAQTTPITMTLEHSFNDNLTEITVNVTITNMGDVDFVMADGRLQVALLEETVEFAEAPGSTNERIFYNVMRKMYPDENGTAVPTILAGESMSFTITGAVPNYIYKLRELKVAAFVQDHSPSSKEVWQAAITESLPIPGSTDATFNANLTAPPSGLCATNITPIVEITNAGDLTITSAIVNVIINGTVMESIMFEGNLMTGESSMITFSELELPNANNELLFTLEGVNGGENSDEFDSENNSTSPSVYFSMPADAIGTTLEEDNEEYSEGYPTSAIVTPHAGVSSAFTVYNKQELAGNGSGTPIGGYGESERSIVVDFYNWDPSASPAFADLIYFKVDLSQAAAPILSFDHAAQGYQFSSGTSIDRLEVAVSNDCGETFIDIWGAEGGDLYTSAASTNLWTSPTSENWTTTNLDIAQFAGDPEIIVRFRAITGYGNTLFLDNINMGMFVATQELTEVSEIRLFPNPVKESMKVTFELEASKQLQVEVFNVVGQRVQNLGTSNFNTGRNQFEINASDLSNGVYFLRIYNADKELNRRFVVQH